MDTAGIVNGRSQRPLVESVSEKVYRKKGKKVASKFLFLDFFELKLRSKLIGLIRNSPIARESNKPLPCVNEVEEGKG